MRKALLAACSVFGAAGLLVSQPASASEPSTTSAVSSCAASARVAVAARPEYPLLAQEIGAAGTALVQVDLKASGALANASIAQSSGNGMLDRAALAAARLSRFQPEVRGCSPVAGSYLYEVEFAQ